MKHRDKFSCKRTYLRVGIITCAAALLTVMVYPALAQTSWTKYSGNPLLGGVSGTWEQSGLNGPSVIKDGDAYKMWYSGHLDGWGNGYRIGYAFSSDGINWTKNESNPVLSADHMSTPHAYQPSVIKDGDIYRMWYSDWLEGTHDRHIAYATSSDGISWTNHGTVLSAGGGWEGTVNLFNCSVIKDGDTYKMWYIAGPASGPGWGQEIGYATSSDGVNWVKYSSPVLTLGAAGEWDDSNLQNPFVMKDGDTYRMWYQGHSSDGISKLGYAISSDGINWTRNEGNPVLQGTAGQWDSSSVSGPSVLLDGSTYKMWYIGPGKVGYATSVPPNQSPTANAQSVTTEEDVVKQIILTGSDPEGSALTFTVTGNPSNGSLSGAAPNLTYTPNADFNGSDSFSFTVSDGQLTSAVATVSITVNPVDDLPVRWIVESGGNGHYYEAVLEKIPWTEAKIAAESKTYLELPGHLVTIQSAEENTFVGNLERTWSFWLGYYQPDGTNWQWVTGELASYTNWNSSEPNNSGGNEDYAMIYRFDPPNGDSGTWLDLANDNLSVGYVIEYEPSPTPVISVSSSLSFGDLNTGSSSQQTLSISNTGNATLNITDISVSGTDAGLFSVSPASLSVNAGQNQNVTVTFSASSAGSKSASLSITHNASGSTASVTLSGTGVVPPTPDLQIGGKIAFRTKRDGNYEIYTMNPDGADQTRLTSESALDAEPSWSPDGSRITFHSTRDGNSGEIYVMNADGTNQTRLTNNSSEDTYNCWSPDGGKIAFASWRDGNPEIYVMNADGTNQTRLTNAPGVDGYPAWSPDGSKIAFVSDRDGTGEYIYLMNPDGTKPTRLTSGTVKESSPAWSPDGNMIAYGVLQGGSPGIYLINADGSGQTQLIGDSAVADHATWSPDGSRISFQSSRNGNPDIYVIDTDGTGLTRLTSNAANDQSPSWADAFRLIGAADVGSEVSRTVTIENKGDADLSVANIASSDGQFTISPTSFTVAAGGSQNVTVTFTPTSVGTKYSTLTVSSNDPDTPMAKLIMNGMTGQGPSPAISLSAITVNAGTVTKGVSGTATFMVSNSGNGTLSATGISSSNAQFTVSPSSFSLFGGESQMVTVTFAPTKMGWEQSTLTIVHNTSGSPSTVTVSGIGRIEPPTGSLQDTRIAFHSSRDGNLEIYTMGSDGADQIRLTNNSAEDDDPSWSPDGTKVAFTSRRDGNDEIYVMDSNGSNPIRLTNNSARDNHAVWSPDGSKIVFHSARDGNSEIYVMNSDGSGQTRLTSSSASDEVPGWAPDGSKIVFHSHRDGQDEIYVMNADGTGETRLTDNSAADNGGVWSPDGTQIAFRSSRDGQDEIYVMNADGTGQMQLTDNAAVDQSPSWSPDGTRIVFASERDGNWEIYTMNADGSGQMRLTDMSAFDLGPSWSPFLQIFGDCHYAVSPAEVTPPATSDNGNFNVSTDSQCGWTATSDVAWITFRSGETGTGNGTVFYTVAANGGTTSRTGHITVGDATVTFTQPSALAPSLSVTSLVAVGNVNVGASGTATFTVGNTGNAALSVTGITVSGSDASQFTVSPMTFTVNAGAPAQTITVTFTPTSAGVKAGTISMTHNAARSPALISLSGTGIDTIPPSAPMGLVATAEPGQVILTWTASGESDLSYYVLYRSLTASSLGDSVGRVDKPATTFTDTGLSGGIYYYRLKAVDNAGNRSGESNQIPVTINQPPTVTGQTVTTNEDVAKQITLSGVDPDGDPLTFAIATQPTKGSVTLSGAVATYTPTANANGTDSFTFTANDGQLTSAPATVSITINAVNDAPTLGDIATQSINEGAGQQSLALPVGPGGGSDEASQTVTVSASNTALIPNPTISGTTLTYSPAVNANGSAILTLRVRDNGGIANGGVDSLLKSFTVTITPVNDAPSFTKGIDQTIDEDAGPQTVNDWATNLSKGPADESGQTLTFVVTNDNTALFSIQPTIDTSSGTLTYTPVVNANGNATVSVKLQDSGGTANGGVDTSATQSFTITVTPNRKPELTAIPGKLVQEGETLSFALSAQDPDGDPLTYGVSGNPAGATLSGSVFSWTPTAGQAGTYTLTFTVNDGKGGIASQPVTITVIGNHPPVLTSIVEQKVEEGKNVTFTLRATDADGDSLTYSVSGRPTGSALSDTTFSWTPASGQAGSYTLIFTVNDGKGGTASQSATITVRPAINHKPVLEDIADQKVLEGEEISFTLSATDADGDSLHFGMSGNPVGSTLSGASFSWTPSLDQVGSHAITFSVSDGKGETDTQSVNLTVERVNHDPVLAAVGRKSIQEGQTLSFALSATDTDGDELRYSVSHNPPGSTLSENVFFWTPTVGQAGFYLVTFTVSDGKGGSHSQTDTISVVEIKPPPSSIKITIDPMVPLDTSDIELQIDATFSSSSATIQNHSAAIEDSVITIALVTDQIEDEAPSAEPLWSFIERIGRLAKGNFLVVVTVNGDEFLHETLRVRGKSSDAGIVFMDFDLTEGNQNKSDTGGAEPGKEFQVQLYIKDAGLILSGWNILLKFDSDMIEYVPGSFKAGSFMPGLVCLEDIKTGEAEIGGAILGETEGVTGGGELGTLSFRVLEGFETETQIYIIENNFRFPEGGSEKYYTFSVATITEKLALIGDFNGDGVVDFNDFFAFADHFGTEAGDENYVVMYDLDGSGRVDFDDFFIFADQFRKKERAKLIALAQQYIDFPSNPILEPNYPNPFNISTTLQYRIIAPTLVHLDVFDLTGQRVKMLVNTYQSPGVHEVIWDGTNDHEKHVSTGIYLTRFQVGGFTEVRKMLLVK